LLADFVGRCVSDASERAGAERVDHLEGRELQSIFIEKINIFGLGRELG